MKTFVKNNLIWMFALVLSIGTMSFNLAKTSSSATSETWYYELDYVPDGGYHREDFSPASGTPNCPGTVSIYCTILAPEDGTSGYPDLSNATILNYKQ